MSETDRPHPSPAQPNLSAEELCVGYGQRRIITDLNTLIPPGSFTVILGPNGCGKSTLLRTFARLLKPQSGAVLLDGSDLFSIPSRSVARTIGLLPQTSTAPEGITVIDLVRRGRYPHRSLLKQWSPEDETAVREALVSTRTIEFSQRRVDELSGGQRQRVWIALVLAQQTPVVLLDEPTTYLDIAHQIELLELCVALHAQGRTLVAVLHDINQAARYASHIIAMRSGAILASGTTREVVTEARIEEVFGVRSRIIDDPETGTPMVVPLAQGSLSPR